MLALHEALERLFTRLHVETKKGTATKNGVDWGNPASLVAPDEGLDLCPGRIRVVSQFGMW